MAAPGLAASALFTASSGERVAGLATRKSKSLVPLLVLVSGGGPE